MSLRRYYYKKIGKTEKARELLLAMRRLASKDRVDRGFRRYLYVRYADDFVVLLTGSRKDALKLREEIAEFLKEECGLELNLDKTTVGNTREGHLFLGANIRRRSNISRFTHRKGKAGNKVTYRASLRMAVDVPIARLIDKLIANGFARRNHLGTVYAKGKTNMIHLTHFDIIRFFNSKCTGILNAYSFAGNYFKLSNIM